MRKYKWLLLLVVFALIAAACGDDEGDDTDTTAADAGGTETTAAADDGGGTETTAAGDEAPMAGAEFLLFGAPGGDEGKAIQGFLDAYNAESGSNIEYGGSEDFEAQLRIRVEGGDPPEVAFTPQPASICAFADEGHLVSLEDMGFDIAEMEANHSKFWMDLGLCADGQHYGIPWFPNYKSIIFYHEPTFTANGYAIPSTWDEMIALSQQIVDDGMTPWCFGFESGGATGWPGTDWLEDILVRQSGGDVYADWFNHDIPFNDPAVISAFDKFGELFFADGFVLGGAGNVAGVAFGDAPGPLFTDPEPGCLMLKQGSFITNFFPDTAGYEDGEESEIKTFPFPTIDGNTGAMGGGDTIMVFDAAPENVEAVKAWITADWMCTLASASGGGVAPYGGHGVAGIERLPGHKDTNLDCYESDQAKAFAGAVTSALAANSFVFDASDLMPPEVGQGSFWEGMINWSQGTSAQEVADTVEASWP
ncbi:MAG: extracellular solute-binding protein [Acidimicrobiia bacterium]|nr:extracellular solute-binding protein [Acidimicrobiia bacterium]